MKLFIIINDGVVDGLSLTEKFENELKNNQITVRLKRFNFALMVSMITSQNELGKIIHSRTKVKTVQGSNLIISNMLT